MHDWAALLGDWPDEVPLGNNVSPGALVPVYAAGGSSGMRWGLIPPWTDGTDNRYATFNARLESVDSKPAFRHAWNHSLRCLLPARGYYEWRLEEGSKQPYFVTLPADQAMLLAGLYEPARNDGIPASCTVLTHAADGNMARLHTRLPVILPLILAGDWFAATPTRAAQIISDSSIREPDFYPVSKRVNNSRTDDQQLVQAVDRTVAML